MDKKQFALRKLSLDKNSIRGKNYQPKNKDIGLLQIKNKELQHLKNKFEFYRSSVLHNWQAIRKNGKYQTLFCLKK